MNQPYRLSENERRLNQTITIGSIAAVDHQAKKLRIEIGNLLTAWLPWPTEMGRNYRRWRPLREGQQVVLAAPSGDLAQAAVIGMLYSTALPAVSDNPDLDITEFEDGARFQYDSASHEYAVETGGSSVTMDRDRILLASNGSTIELDASGIRINGARIDLN